MARILPGLFLLLSGLVSSSAAAETLEGILIEPLHQDGVGDHRSPGWRIGTTEFDPGKVDVRELERLVGLQVRLTVTAGQALTATGLEILDTTGASTRWLAVGVLIRGGVVDNAAEPGQPLPKRNADAPHRVVRRDLDLIDIDVLPVQDRDRPLSERVDRLMGSPVTITCAKTIANRCQAIAVREATANVRSEDLPTARFSGTLTTIKGGSGALFAQVNTGLVYLDGPKKDLGVVVHSMNAEDILPAMGLRVEMVGHLATTPLNGGNTEATHWAPIFVPQQITAFSADGEPLEAIDGVLAQSGEGWALITPRFERLTLTLDTDTIQVSEDTQRVRLYGTQDADTIHASGMKAFTEGLRVDAVGTLIRDGKQWSFKAMYGTLPIELANLERELGKKDLKKRLRSLEGQRVQIEGDIVAHSPTMDEPHLRPVQLTAAP